jgi:beta-phosphoglucomutase
LIPESSEFGLGLPWVNLTDTLAAMSNWPRAVLFDFDGVIVNSEPLHFFAFHQILAAEKIELSEEEYYRELIGFDDRGAFRHLFEKRNLHIEPKDLLRLMTRKSEVVMELIEDRKYQALPGVEELVRGLWRHYPLAICSGALREEIEAMLEGIALRDCFTIIVAAEDVTVGKPDPQGYLLCTKLVAEKLNLALKPGDCLIVEDAPSVIKSVKAVGFPTLGVATSHDLEKLSAADWRVKTLDPREVATQIPDLELKP